MGGASAVTSWLPEPADALLCPGRGQIWGEEGIGLDRPGYHALQPPDFSGLKQSRSSLAHSVHTHLRAAECLLTLTQVHGADTLTQVLVARAEGQRAPDCAVQWGSH